MTDEPFQHLRGNTITLRLDDCFVCTVIPRTIGKSQDGFKSIGITLPRYMFNSGFIKKNELLQIYIIPVNKIDK